MLELRKNEALISFLPAPSGWLVLAPTEEEGVSVYLEVAGFARIRVLVDKPHPPVGQREQATRLVALVTGDGIDLAIPPDGSILISPLRQMQHAEQMAEENEDVDEET